MIYLRVIVVVLADVLVKVPDLLLIDTNRVEQHLSTVLVKPERRLSFQEADKVRVMLFVVLQILRMKGKHIVDGHNNIEHWPLFRLDNSFVSIDVLANKCKLDMLK